ncbi:hypothetical protein ACPXCP_11990 [Streptomyces sp. DT20]|uniref:hypothetical protein n=1 Tax=unclassified Streptomyces TaxID=2593676 RepID=UPI00308F6BFD|nr:hypothetical protein OG892_38775 [Streptomyces sp. NBC_00341]
MAQPVEAGPTPPSYPPRTPPPPKKPPNPPRPNPQDPKKDTAADTVVPTARRGAGMRNRRGRNWVLESAPWAAGKARPAVVEQLGSWGYRPATTVLNAVEEVTTLLVEAAVADGGTSVSVHLSDQDGHACILALSHCPGLTTSLDETGQDVLHSITAHPPVTGCGTDTGPDGRRIWAVLTL